MSFDSIIEDSGILPDERSSCSCFRTARLVDVDSAAKSFKHGF
jgi:hypothetical protein